MAAASGRKQFVGADLHFLNAAGATSEGFTPVPPAHTELAAHVLSIAAVQEHNGVLPALDLEGARSFVAKVALGLAAGFAGDQFLVSEGGRRLQSVLAARTYDEIDALVPTMRGFGHATDLLGRIVFPPKGTHTFALAPSEDAMTLAFSLWAEPWFTAFVDLGSLANWPEALREGAVVLVDIHQRKVLGPFTQDAFLLWCSGARHGGLDAAGLSRPDLPTS
jgi:hypothetical protein